MSDHSATEHTASIAIIGGTGLSTFERGAAVAGVATPYGDASAEVLISSVQDRPVAFLARHGNPHRLPPHTVNYRANLWLLKQLGVDSILAVNAVGGIRADLAPGTIVVPDQLIDYTYGREQTFSVDGDSTLQHIDFSYPFSGVLRDTLLAAAAQCSIGVADSAVYGVTQGPRLETAAEIDRLQRDGCDIVGMTAMPEAALARELAMDYASVCLVVNPAAGRSERLITMDDVHAVVDTGMVTVKRLLVAKVNALEV